jgi:serine palmitoyltransferase
MVFAIRTRLKSRTSKAVLYKAHRRGMYHFHVMRPASLHRKQEVDDLVDEWTSEPVANELSATEQSHLDAVAVISEPNSPKPKLVSTGKTVLKLATLTGKEHTKQSAVETLGKYGLGSVGPPGFYRTRY